MQKKRSLFVTLVLVVIATITLGMASYSSYLYFVTKEKLVYELENHSRITSTSLQKNLASYIASYSVNDYERIIENEMGREDIYAIVIEDYNMAKILAKPFYITGKIRDADWNVIPYDPHNIEHRKKLRDAFSVYRIDILDTNSVAIGTLNLYMSDRYLLEELYGIIKNNFFTSLILSIILIFFLFLAMNNLIFKSLHKIIEVIKDSDEEGIPKHYASQEDSKEMSLLVHAINNMIDAIKQSRVRLKEQEEVLTYQAHHDSLTDLPNRVLFQDRLEQGILKAKRDKTRLALFFIDLDQFKEINDSYGHDAGDEILKASAQRIKSVLRTHDTLARLGGDEFTIILENITKVEDVSSLANKVLQSLHEPMLVENNMVYFSLSIGISLYPDDGDSAQALLKYADSAMYKAKNDGRNTFRFYSSDMTESAYEKVFMETSLREAIKNEEFVVYYQPQVDAVTDTITGMEALVRWEHPRSGLVSPAAFLPIAETTGLILEIDRWVMKTAMLQVRKWYAQGLEPGVLSLNLTMKQLQDENFVNLFVQLMEETGYQSEWLELEITEGQIMTNPHRTIEILNQLNGIGIDIAVDDFGTGYSSLAYLKKLPIDKLKIDKSFVDNLPLDEEDSVISRIIISLAQNLNLKIIAEGVETKEQKDFLVENGCTHIQGYYYSKPIPSNEMELLLQEGFSKT